MPHFIPRTLVALALVLPFPIVAQQQQPAEDAEQHALFATIAAQDTALFDAVNHCELTTLQKFWSPDAEFYHDRTDPMLGRDRILESIKTNLCGKVERRLVPGTLEVYPVHGYGAVEIGVHRFYHPGVQDHGVVGEARFIHLWRYKDGQWQITRVISYDHGLAK